MVTVAGQPETHHLGIDVGTPFQCIIKGFNDQNTAALNVESTLKLAQSITIPVIASGGITNMDDIRALCAVSDEGIMGAITGRALYEGSLDLAAAQKLADDLCGTQE